MADTMVEREGILSISDAAEIGFKVVEMADRLFDVDLALPGSQAKQAITIDDVEFIITVTRSPALSHPEEVGK